MWLKVLPQKILEKCKYQGIFLLKSVFGENINLVDLHGSVNQIQLCSILISDSGIFIFKG